MRTTHTEIDEGSDRSTLKRILTLLGFTFVAGYLLGRRRTEREWETGDDWSEGTTVEIDGDDDEPPVPGEPFVGEESDPAAEVPDAGEVREAPDEGADGENADGDLERGGDEANDDSEAGGDDMDEDDARGASDHDADDDEASDHDADADDTSADDADEEAESADDEE